MALAPFSNARDRNDVTWFAESAQTPVQLDRFEVRDGRADSDRESYQSAQIQSATKTSTPLLDVPQAVTIVTEKQIKDQQLLSVGDVVRYVPGITAHQGENNRDQIIFRGNSSSADFFVNGVRDDVQYYRDLYNVSRLEVLRGPNAMIFGRGGGGGLINRVLKEPLPLPLREVSVGAGSFGFLRATADFNEPISERFAVRLNALAEDSDSFRRGVSLERSAVNPTASFAFNADTRATLSYEHMRDRRTADRGITSMLGRPAPVPIETFYGNPDGSHVRADVDFLSATLSHRLADGEIRNRTLYADYDRGYQNYVPGAVNAAQTLVTLTAYNNATRRTNLFNQTDVTQEFTRGAIKHTLLGGLELGLQRTENFRNTGYFNNTATSIQVPYAAPTIQTPVTFRQSATDADNHLRTQLAGLYVQDQIEFSPAWQAVLGLRWDEFALDYYNHRTGEHLRRVDQLVSPRAGLVFKPRPSVSAYASLSVSHLPSSGDQFSSLTTVTEQVKPERFLNRELGLKWEPTRTLAITTAIYQLDRTNTRATDPADPTRILQTGSTRTSGAELGVSGRVTEVWSVSGGYAYQDAYIRSATTAAPAGAQVAQVPRHNFSLWNRYDFRPRLGLGLGLVSRSAMFAAIDNTVVLPGYARLDAAAYVPLGEHCDLQVNLENVAGIRYYVNADSNTNLTPGAPRSVRVALRARF
ncbi:MAG TPA: TonB-dependent siderophore receptor [Opitutaceae bacterium]|nr:TonB-dependent siderophore receptor [Opitutaceae bacterium]HND62492.1 TonB-dependent siderophore receptor [Opitutaceae bacterium]